MKSKLWKIAPLWGAGERSETEGVTPTPAKAGHGTKRSPSLPIPSGLLSVAWGGIYEV